MNPNVQVRNIPGLNIPQHTTVELNYVGTTNNLSSVVYKEGTNTVATLTFAYVGGVPSSDDARLLSVTRS